MKECNFQNLSKKGEYYLFDEDINGQSMLFKSKVMILNGVNAENLKFMYDVVFLGDVKIKSIEASGSVSIFGDAVIEELIVAEKVCINKSATIDHLEAKNVEVGNGGCSLKSAIISQTLYSYSDIFIQDYIKCQLIYCEGDVVIEDESNVDRIVYKDFCDMDGECNELIKIGTVYIDEKSNSYKNEDIKQLNQDDDWETILEYLEKGKAKSNELKMNYFIYNKYMLYSEYTHLNNLNEYVDILYYKDLDGFLFSESELIKDVEE